MFSFSYHFGRVFKRWGFLEFIRWLLGTVAIIAAWLMLQWRMDLPFSRGDSLTSFLHVFRLLGLARGDWDLLAYDYRWLGGVRLAESIGPSILASGFAWLGFSPAGMENCLIILTQATLGFWTTRLSSEWGTRWFGSKPPSLFLWTALSLSAAFLPIIGWRVFSGHVLLLGGAIPALALATLTVSAFHGSLSPVLFLMGVVSVWLPLTTQSLQLFYYGVLWTLPVTAVFAIGRGCKPVLTGFAYAGVALVAGLLLAGPEIAAMARFYGSDEASRMPSIAAMYTYTTQGWRDWLSSLFAISATAPSGRHAFLLQDTHFPFGRELLLAVCVLSLVKPKRRALLASLLIPLCLVMLVSSDVPPFSTVFLHWIPGYSAFRVPARAMIPLILLFWSAALTWVAARAPLPGKHGRRYAAIAAGLGIVVIAVDLPLLSETLGWLAAGALALSWLRPRAFAKFRAFGLAVFPLLIAANVASFPEKRPKHGVRSLVDLEAQLDFAKRTYPVVSGFPVTGVFRGEVDFKLGAFGPNTAMNLGIPGLSGVLYPLRRYNQLFTLLENKNFSPLRTYFVHKTDEGEMRPLSLLYNVTDLYSLGPGPEIAVRSVIPRRLPGAWTSEVRQPVENLGPAVAALRSVEDLLRAQLVKPDSPFGSAIALPCDASVQSVTVSSPQNIGLSLTKASICPITVSINFSRILAARCVDSPSATIHTYPAYGPVLGLTAASPCKDYAIEAHPVIQGAWLRLLGGLVALTVAVGGQHLANPQKKRLRRAARAVDRT